MTKPVPAKKEEIIDGITIKYHANGKTIWSRGKIVDGKADGYWEWYRLDGTRKRSGYFDKGEPVGEWTTYDKNGNIYKVERKIAAAPLNEATAQLTDKGEELLRIGMLVGLSQLLKINFHIHSVFSCNTINPWKE